MNAPQVIDCTGGQFTLAALHTLAQLINSGGQVTIINCSGLDIQKLGFYLMAEYDKSRKAIGLEPHP